MINHKANETEDVKNTTKLNDENNLNGISKPPTNEEGEIPLIIKGQKVPKNLEDAKAPVSDDAHPTLVKHPTSFIETLINLIKGNSGAGMFAMGDAFKNAGLLVGPILTLFLGSICIYGNHILINACKTIRSRKKIDHLPSFGETVQYCFEEGPERIRKYAHHSRLLTSICISITQLGFCSVYFIFISSTLKSVLGSHRIYIDLHIYMIIILIPILLTALVQTLKYLTPFSFIANICLMSGVAMTLYLTVQDLPPLSTRKAAVNLSQLPLFFGTTIYSFEGISLVLPLQNEMRNPEKFGTPFGVLNIGMSFICCVLISIGFFGYLKHGDDVGGSLTLNLPKNQVFSELVQMVISIGILFSYTLQLYVAVKTLWPPVERNIGPFKNKNIAEKLFRVFMVLVTFTLAQSVPNIGLFISLFGAIGGTALALIFPVICDIILRWPNDFGSCKWRLWLNFYCLFTAFLGLTTGSYYSIKAIVNTYL